MSKEQEPLSDEAVEKLAYEMIDEVYLGEQPPGIRGEITEDTVRGWFVDVIKRTRGIYESARSKHTDLIKAMTEAGNAMRDCLDAGVIGHPYKGDPPMTLMRKWEAVLQRINERG